MKRFIMNNWKKFLIVIGAAFIIYNVSNILSTGSSVINAYKENRDVVANDDKDDKNAKPAENKDQKENVDTNQNNNTAEEENNNQVKPEENSNPNSDNTTHDELPKRD